MYQVLDTIRTMGAHAVHRLIDDTLRVANIETMHSFFGAIRQQALEIQRNISENQMLLQTDKRLELNKLCPTIIN